MGRGSSGPGSHMPALVASPWVPTSFSIAGLIQGLGPGAFRRMGLLLWMEISEGNLRIAKTEIRKRELRTEGHSDVGVSL